MKKMFIVLGIMILSFCVSCKKECAYKDGGYDQKEQYVDDIDSKDCKLLNKTRNTIVIANLNDLKNKISEIERASKKQDILTTVDMQNIGVSKEEDFQQLIKFHTIEKNNPNSIIVDWHSDNGVYPTVPAITLTNVDYEGFVSNCTPKILANPTNTDVMFNVHENQYYESATSGKSTMSDCGVVCNFIYPSYDYTITINSEADLVAAANRLAELTQDFRNNMTVERNGDVHMSNQRVAEVQAVYDYKDHQKVTFAPSAYKIKLVGDSVDMDGRLIEVLYNDNALEMTNMYSQNMAYVRNNVEYVPVDYTVRVPEIRSSSYEFQTASATRIPGKIIWDGSASVSGLLQYAGYPRTIPIDMQGGWMYNVTADFVNMLSIPSVQLGEPFEMNQDGPIGYFGDNIGTTTHLNGFDFTGVDTLRFGYGDQLGTKLWYSYQYVKAESGMQVPVLYRKNSGQIIPVEFYSDNSNHFGDNGKMYISADNVNNSSIRNVIKMTGTTKNIGKISTNNKNIQVEDWLYDNGSPQEWPDYMATNYNIVNSDCEFLKADMMPDGKTVYPGPECVTKRSKKYAKALKAYQVAQIVKKR